MKELNKLEKWIEDNTSERLAQVAKAADTSPAYIRQVASGFRNCSKGFAEKLEQAMNHDVSAVEIMFPDRFPSVGNPQEAA